MDKVVKFGDQSGVVLQKGKLRATSSPFQQRVNQAKSEQVDPATMPNRLCLMLDKSSSMSSAERVGSKATVFNPDGSGSKQRIELLKDALDNFIARCDLNTTSIAIETFPPSIELALTSNAALLSGIGFGLQASGNTPMRGCVERCLGKIPMTRGIIVSDGEATDWHSYHYDDWDEETSRPQPNKDDLLTKYKELSIPIDCVHISNDSGGEELLRRIARETGGIFIKFTDVSSFASSFAYLTPSYRAMLTDGRVSAEQMGAREVRR